MTGDGLLRRRDEEGLSRFEQRTANKPKTRLDRKSPIQVRIPFSSQQRESATNCFAIGCTAPPAVVRRKISPRAHGATRPPGYDARYSVILVPIFVRRCSPFPYVPSPVFLLSPH